MVAGKNEIFRPLYLAGLVIDFLLHLNKNELADKIQDGIFRQNVFPHIGYAVFILKSRIPCTSCHPLAVTHVKGQKEGSFPSQFGCHIDFFQIHSEVYKAARLEQEQTGLGVSLSAVLINGVLVRLSGGVTLQLKRNDGKAVQKNYHIDTLFIAGPDLLHDREDILAIFARQFWVEGGGRLCVHQFQLLIRDFDTMFQYLDQAATGFGGFSIDKAYDGILQIVFVDFPQVVHGVRLGVIQELEHHFPVNSEQAVKISRSANDIAVVLREPFQKKLLIFLFRENIIHGRSPRSHHFRVSHHWHQKNSQVGLLHLPLILLMSLLAS